MLRWLARGEKHRSPSSIPDGLRIYAIGDIHGRLDCLRALEDCIRRDLDSQPAARPVIIHLGDYVDRGADSRGVLEALQAPALPGVERRFLRGNHEEMLMQVLEEPGRLAEWRGIGGLETLHSYGVDLQPALRGGPAEEVIADFNSRLPSAHLAFLQRSEMLLRIGDYAFVHAGVRPGVPLTGQLASDLLWIREPFLGHDGDFGARVVHGHTPVEEADIRPNRINVDTGAYLSDVLTAAVLEGEGLRILTSDRPAWRSGYAVRRSP